MQVCGTLKLTVKFKSRVRRTFRALESKIRKTEKMGGWGGGGGGERRRRERTAEMCFSVKQIMPLVFIFRFMIVACSKIINRQSLLTVAN